MASRTRNSSSSSKKASPKAQFFILSAMAIIGILFFFSQWMRAPTIVDVSTVFLREEVFLFDNIVAKATDTVVDSADCSELNYNLNEYKNFVVGYVAGKGMDLNFNYLVASCTDAPRSGTVTIQLALTSPQAKLERALNLNW